MGESGKSKLKLVPDSVQKVVLDIKNIYKSAEDLIDLLENLPPIKKFEKFNALEGLLYKIDNMIPEVLEVYSKIITDKKSRIFCSVIEVSIFSILLEFKESRYKLS